MSYNSVYYHLIVLCTVKNKKKQLEPKHIHVLLINTTCWDFTAACHLLQTKTFLMAIDLNLPPADGDPLDLNEDPLLEDDQAMEDEQAAAQVDVQAAAVEDEQNEVQVDVQAATQGVCHHFDLNIPAFDEHEEIHGGNHVLLYRGCIFCFFF